MSEYRDDTVGLVRFESEAERIGYTRLSNFLVRYAPCSHGALCAYLLLRDFARQEDSCYPGHQLLGAHLGVSRHQVMRYLKELESVGLIKILRHGKRKTNEYLISEVKAEMADPSKVAATREKVDRLRNHTTTMTALEKRRSEFMEVKRKIGKKIFERDGHRCRECGATDRLTIDHIFPLEQGGPDDEDNLQTLCRPCNSRKGPTLRRS